MTRSTERALIKSAAKYHAAPVTLVVDARNDEPRRYAVALDPWDNPERAKRELDRSQYRRAH